MDENSPKSTCIDTILDLETLGFAEDSVIRDIGAVAFNRYTGEVLDTFRVLININDAVGIGQVMEPSTVMFWLTQSKESIDSVWNNVDNVAERCPRDAVNAMNRWLSGLKGRFNTKKLYVWNHKDFDSNKMENLHKKLGNWPEWKHYDHRDIWTHMDNCELDGRDFPRVGTYHTTVDDCKHYMGVIVAGFNKMRDNSKVPAKYELHDYKDEYAEI